MSVIVNKDIFTNTNKQTNTWSLTDLNALTSAERTIGEIKGEWRRMKDKAKSNISKQT